MVRDLLGPAFRELGLRGSGGRYSLAHESGWALVSLQKSAYSDQSEILFTVNLLAVSRPAWEAARRERTHLPQKPSAGVRYGVGEAETRLGLLLPGAEDTWWRVVAGSDLIPVAAAVTSAVQSYGVPWLRENSDF